MSATPKPKVRPITRWKRMRLYCSFHPRGHYYIWSMRDGNRYVEAIPFASRTYFVGRWDAVNNRLVFSCRGPLSLSEAKAEGERMLGITPLPPRKKAKKGAGR